MKLLQEPRLPRLHRAGLHTILAHSPNDPVWHAEESLRIYETLYPDGTVPTAEQAEGHKELLEDARRVQAMAHAAEEARVIPTEEEEYTRTKQYLTALKEEEDRFWDGEADVVDHGDGEEEEIVDHGGDDDDEIMDVAEGDEAEAEAATAEDEEMVTGPAWDPEEKNMMRPMREESPVVPEIDYE